MARFVNNKPVHSPESNKEKIIEFLMNRYNWSDDIYDYIPPRDKFIDDVRMAGDIVNERSYTILISNPITRETAVINTSDVKIAKQCVIEYLRNKDGFILSHIFHDGKEISVDIKVEFNY